jgi:bacterioferritin (cytochrome b1)
MNKQETISTLNNLLKGTNIAIDSYHHYISHVNNDDLRHRLESQQLTHKLVAQELTSLIRDLGGEPKEGSGLTGLMSEFSNSIKLATGDKPIEILDMVQDGLEMGILQMQEAAIHLEGTPEERINNYIQQEMAILDKIRELRLEPQYLH